MEGPKTPSAALHASQDSQEPAPTQSETPTQDSPSRQLVPTQATAEDYLQTLDSLEEAACEEFNSLQRRVCSATDPSEKVREALQKCAVDAWRAVQGESVSHIDIPLKLGQARDDTVQNFHKEWSKNIYNVKDIYEAINFQRKPSNVSLRDFVEDHCLGFFSELLETSAPDPIRAQKDTSLQSMAPAMLAQACCRVSVANGLPPDGHVLFAAFQGQCAFYWQGANGSLENRAMQASDSEWNVGATKLPLIVQGDSATGKDNAKRVVLQWLEFLNPLRRPATKALLPGNITITGILGELKDNEGQLQIVNGELEKVLNRRKDKMLQEADIIELLDGTCAFGKRTGAESSCLAPVVWALVGAQLPVYAREMGSESNGRLRFVMVAIDPGSVQETSFEEKLVPHKASNLLLCQVLQEILAAQQQVPSQAREEDEEASDAAPSQASRRIQLRVSRRKRAKSQSSNPAPERAASAMTVARMIWSPAATLVLAGVTDGSAKACKARDNRSGSSVVTKHAGKAYGAIATANVAARNGLLRVALGAAAPMDATVRLLDALAAIPRMELCSVNQFLAEKHIAHRRKSEKQHEEPAPSEQGDAIPDLEPIQFAARRLLDTLASHDPKPDETQLFARAETDGIPLKVNQKTVWYNYRQLHFSRSRKRQEGLLKYGGSQVLNDHGTAAGWKSLLQSLVTHGVGKLSEDEKTVRIRYCRRGADYLDVLKVTSAAQRLYVAATGAA